MGIALLIGSALAAAGLSKLAASLQGYKKIDMGTFFLIWLVVITAVFLFGKTTGILSGPTVSMPCAGAILYWLVPLPVKLNFLF